MGDSVMETGEAGKLRKKRSIGKKILIGVGIFLGVILLLVAGVFGWLTITEYNPADRESLTVSGAEQPAAPTETTIKLLTWNVGYGALGDNADFFMDGGSSVYTADEDRVNANMSEMLAVMKEQSPDFILLQEVDEDCSRSYGINEVEMFAALEKGYQSTFAYNFKVKYVPYPLPPIGRVNSGIQTLSVFRITSAERVKLPSPFSWPVSIGNLKRCLSVHRIPVEGSDRELVLINLHLEAYDSGEGKIEQTKVFREVMESELVKGNYVIAGGDFNQAFSDADISAYPQQDGKWQCGRIDVTEFSDRLTFVTDTGAPTCRSLDQSLADADRETFQYYVVDGYVVSDNIEILSVKTLDLAFHATDHNPVVMEVKLRGESE